MIVLYFFAARTMQIYKSSPIRQLYFFEFYAKIYIRREVSKKIANSKTGERFNRSKEFDIFKSFVQVCDSAVVGVRADGYVTGNHQQHSILFLLFSYPLLHFKSFIKKVVLPKKLNRRVRGV